jgi:hypothetical protein
VWANKKLWKYSSLIQDTTRDQKKKGKNMTGSKKLWKDSSLIRATTRDPKSKCKNIRGLTKGQVEKAQFERESH